jgi:hypothetical protein
MDDIVNQIIGEVAQAVTHGNVALWIGDGAQDLDSPSSSLLEIPWLGIWTERKNENFSVALEHYLSNHNDPNVIGRRFVRSVPRRIEETLGTYFSFVDVCPVFYINGVGNEWKSRSERENRRDRDEKTDQLDRLHDAVLIVAGINQPQQVSSFLRDELGGDSENLRVLFVDVPAETIESILRSSEEQIKRLHVRFTVLPIDELANRIKAFRVPSTESNTQIKIGSDLHSIRSELQRESPIDEFFDIITLDNFEIIEKEHYTEMVRRFLRGQSCSYQVLSNALHWPRNTEFLGKIRKLIFSERKTNRSNVHLYNILCEPGSGATTFLKEVAVSFARDGYPALFCGERSSDIDYDTLRTFLESLPDSKRIFPPILIFDAKLGIGKRDEDFGRLPANLARDGQKCTILRAVSISETLELTPALKSELSLRTRNSRFEEFWIAEPISARLSLEEQTTLQKWTHGFWGSAGASNLADVLGDWNETRGNTPFLIYLYFVLQNEIGATTEIGKHLFDRMQSVFAKIGVHNYEAVLTGETLRDAVSILQSRFSPRGSDITLIDQFRTLPSVEKIVDLFFTLVVLARLRLEVTRGTLARITEIPSVEVQNVLLELEKIDLSTIFEPSRKAPTVFYSDRETVGMRHPGYGDVVLSWFGQAADTENKFEGSQLTLELKRLVSEECDERYPLRLLKPILRKLTSIPEDVEFADTVAKQLMRIQRVPGSQYHEWLWKHNKADVLLELFGCISEEVVTQKASLLHSRGITTYKSCTPTMQLNECRSRYLQAAKDFELAIKRSESQVGGEHPANIASSQGMLFLGWAKKEKDDGNKEKALQLEVSAWESFSHSLELRPNNPFAAYGLVSLILQRSERKLKESDHAEDTSELIAEDLAKVCELLQLEPTESLRVEWEKMWQRLLQLLNENEVDKIIHRLKSKGAEIGFAIDALRVLRGWIPIEPTQEIEESELIEKALDILENSNSYSKESYIGSFLRYVLFSAHADRLVSPCFDERYSRIKKLVGTPYLKNPIWLFDLGMLALQMRDFQVASDSFRQLRYGRKFLEVPTTRACVWVKEGEPEKPQPANLRVLQVDNYGKGWARLDLPSDFKEPFPFSVKEFSAQGKKVAPGMTSPCYMRIRPSGFFAIPHSSIEGD